MSVVWYILVLLVIAAAIAYVVYNYQRIRKMPEGTQEMAEMAGIIRSGANTFMKTEYKTIVAVVIVLAAVFLMVLGGALLLEGIYDIVAYLAWQQTPSLQTAASGIDCLLLTGTIIFGMLAGVWALMQGYAWFTNEKLCCGKYPFLALAFPLWLWMRLGRYVVSYSSAVSVVETFYDYAMLVVSLLFAMAFARYVAGQTNYQSPTVFWTALATLLCGVSSTCTRFVMYLTGETEAYRASQLARLTDFAVALFAAAVAVALVMGKSSIEESKEMPPKPSEGQNLLDELLPKDDT